MLAPALIVTVEVGVVQVELLQNWAPAPPPDKLAVIGFVIRLAGTKVFISSNTRTVVDKHLLVPATCVDDDTAIPTDVLAVVNFVGTPVETLTEVVASGVHPATYAVKVILAPGVTAVSVGLE